MLNYSCYFIIYIYNKRCRIRRKQLLELCSLINESLNYQKHVKKTQLEFRHDLLESQRRINYHNDFDRLQGAKKLPGLDPHVKNIMNDLQQKNETITERFTFAPYLLY